MLLELLVIVDFRCLGNAVQTSHKSDTTIFIFHPLFVCSFARALKHHTLFSCPSFLVLSPLIPSLPLHLCKLPDSLTFLLYK